MNTEQYPRDTIDEERQQEGVEAASELITDIIVVAFVIGVVLAIIVRAVSR